MARKWLSAVAALGACLAGTAPAPAQSQTEPALVSGGDALDRPAFQGLRPQLRAYATALSRGDMAAFAQLTAPQFSIIERPGGAKTGARALRDMVGLVTGFPHGDIPIDPTQQAVTEPGDGPYNLTAHTLTIRKSFAKPDRVVLFLKESATWVPADPKATLPGGGALMSRFGGSWGWRQTWTRTSEGWKLASLAVL